MAYTQYKITYRNDEVLTCDYCGDDTIKNATMIEWNKGHERQILCDEHLGQLYRNEKDIKILADIGKR